MRRDAVVITLTRGGSPWMKECFCSIAEATDARHLVWHCEPEQYVERRMRGSEAADFVAFVDDDDLLHPGALEACIDALEATGAGIAFTHEQRIDERGAPMGVNLGATNLMDIAMHPTMLHHLAVMRGGLVADHVADTATRIGSGIDWLMKAWIAKEYGVVKVPMIGYSWRQRSDSMSRREAGPYAQAMSQLRETILIDWGYRHGPVEHFVPGRSPTPDASRAA